MPSNIDEVRGWVDSSDYDLETAKSLLQSGRYIYVIFLCHLTLEKILKAHVVASIGTSPPKTHDLLYLLKRTALQLEQGPLDFIGKINNASIPTRYPDDIRRTVKEYTMKVAESYLRSTEDLQQWLKSKLKSEES